MSSLFTKIINREIPAFIVYEDDKVIVFLDQFPLQLGHVLVVSKTEIDSWLDVSQADYLAVHSVAQKIGRAIARTIKYSQAAQNLTNPIPNSPDSTPKFERIGQIVDGRAVPHFHLHLIPLFEGQDINQHDQKRQTFDIEQMQKIQSKIINNLENKSV